MDSAQDFITQRTQASETKTDQQLTSSRNLASGLSPLSISNAPQTEQKPINNDSRVQPFKIRTGENTMGSEDEDWDTSPSPTTEAKKSLK